MGGITVDDFTSSMDYHEIFGRGLAEGQLKGRQAEAAALTVRQQQCCCGMICSNLQARIHPLPLNAQEPLADTLLNFQGANDLASWLSSCSDYASSTTTNMALRTCETSQKASLAHRPTRKDLRSGAPAQWRSVAAPLPKGSTATQQVRQGPIWAWSSSKRAERLPPAAFAGTKLLRSHHIDPNASGPWPERGRPRFFWRQRLTQNTIVWIS